MSTDSKLAEQSRRIAACRRVMDLIDAYVERPNAGNRLSIREGLWELAAHSPNPASGTSEQEQAGEAVAVCGFIPVRESAIKWLKEKYPALCEKAGLCERIGGRLYTVTHSSKYDRLAPKLVPQQPLSDERIRAVRPLPFSNAELDRLYANIPPTAQQDARSREAFKRIARWIEAAHSITKEPKT